MAKARRQSNQELDGRLKSLETSPDAELYLDVPNGSGSTATRIGRFSNVQKQTGNGVFYAYSDSATEGMSVQILKPGLYFVASSLNPGSPTTVGISVNSNLLTTNLSSLTYAQGKRAEASSAGTGITGLATTVLRLNFNDVIRYHHDGTTGSANPRTYFHLLRVGN